MITEDYVSFETAKLLRDKGFDESCEHIYDEEGYLSANNCGYINGESPNEYFRALAPTLQMAMKWLREVHDCSIEITSNGYLMDNDTTWECDIKFKHRLYFHHIQCENTYEDCAKAAIKYCLEILI